MDAIKLLGSLMGNNATGGNVLGSLLGGGGGSSSGGGLGALAGMLGGGGGSSSAGGLGALASMLGGAGGGGGNAASSGGGLGALLGGLAGGGAPARRPEPKEENDAVLLIKAMCNAAKADGKIDQSEVKNIVGRLGEVDQAEARFLEEELQAPLDIRAFVASVPDDMVEQVYAFSVMGMKLDTQQEAKYLGAVAEGLRLNPQVANQIHAKLGAPQIFK